MVKVVYGIPFLERGHATGRDPAYPMCCALPTADSIRIIHANCAISLDDSPPTFSDLPFQGVTGQAFAGRTRPCKSPKILLPSGALALLNPDGHLFEFAPRAGRRPVPIPSEQILSVK